ncbi:Nesprin-2 [Manis pentadactyla]|nr:Nesprin-2 [Manis pentadactyla]
MKAESDGVNRDSEPGIPSEASGVCENHLCLKIDSDINDLPKCKTEKSGLFLPFLSGSLSSTSTSASEVRLWRPYLTSKGQLANSRREVGVGCGSEEFGRMKGAGGHHANHRHVPEHPLWG